MKRIFWLAVFVFALVVAGVMTFRQTPGNVQVDIHTQTLQQQADRAVQEGRHLLKKAEQSSQTATPPRTTAAPPQTTTTPPQTTPAPPQTTAAPPQTTGASHAAIR